MTDVPDNFLGLPPELSDPETARYVVLPVPYEGTVSYEGGTADGPRAIIEASQQVELFDEQMRREIHLPGVATVEPVPSAETPEAEMNRVAEAARPIIQRGQFLLTLGGEHSITAPLVALAREKYGKISVLQIDAHADLRDSYDGSRHSHACVMRRVLEVADYICQVGIRAWSAEEEEALPDCTAAFITPRHIEQSIADDVHLRGNALDHATWIDQVLEMLGPEPVYITVDIDGLDPSLCPGTGTPEPGGLSWTQVTSLLRRVCRECSVVAADVVEVRPIPPHHVTEFVAARLAAKLIAYTQ